MIEKNTVLKLVEDFIVDTDMFVVDIKISRDNRINVIIDSDTGVKVQDCINISRAIESNLDREEEDFALSVMSFGVGEPLVLKRQYSKNIGRMISIRTSEEEYIKGRLKGVSEDSVVVLAKPKSKKAKEEEIEIEIKNIEEAKIIASFK